jgi:PAS domain S-box-containing protein
MIKTQTRLMLLLVALVGCFAAGLVVWNQLEKARINRMLADLEIDKAGLLNDVATLKGASLASMVYDYTFWDDMVDFVRKPDSDWADENIDAGLASFHATAMWIFRPDFSLVYSDDITPEDGPTTLPVTVQQLASLLRNHRFPHFFAYSTGGLLEVRGAPVQPTADNERKTVPQGYLFAADVWGEEYLSDMEGYIGGRLRLVVPSADSGSWVSSRDDAVVRFSRDLTGWDGSVLAVLRGEVDSGFLRELNRAMTWRTWVAVAFACTLILLWLAALHLWVTRPLRLVSQALSGDNSAPIAAMKKNRTEFGHVIRLISQFFQQRADLVEEIAGRVGVEEALRTSEERFRRYFELGLIGMAIVSREKYWLEVNDRLCDIFGYSREEMMDLTWADLTYPEDLTASQALLRQMLAGEIDSYVLDKRYVRKDGQIIFASISVACVRKLDETVDYAVALVDDITERKRAEEALRQSEERYRRLYNNTPVMQHSIDRDGILTSVSDYWLAGLGYEREEVVGRSSLDFLTEASRRYIRETVIPEFSKTGVCRDIELQYVKKNGEVIDALLFAAAERDASGVIVQSLAVVADVTERKRADREHEEVLAKLEKAQRMESLAVLAGGVAHDLNNILGPLVAYPELILARLPQDSPVRKNIEAMGRSAVQAAAIIRDLLTLARRGRYEMVATDLNEVISGYIASPNFLDLMQKNPKVVHSLELKADLPPIRGSATHLSTVLMNLVVNAVDAMPDGGELVIKSHTSFHSRLAGGFDRIVPGDYAVITVTDTGVGIAEKDMAKIFEPYYSNKKMSRSSGSGLGLSVVYGIVKDHKGYYDVVSAPGKGTSFSLLFPVQSEAVGTSAKKEDSLEGSESILVVDDDDEQRQLAADLLQSLGYHVTTADSGAEAIRRFSEQGFDLVVMDMIMGDLDGLDTYSRMLEKKPGQRAIVVSGYAATERVEEMQRLGAGMYVKKPFTRQELGRAVRDELTRNSFIETSRKTQTLVADV